MGDGSFDSDGSSGRWKGIASPAGTTSKQNLRGVDAQNARQGGKPYSQKWPVPRVVAQASMHPQFQKRLAWGLAFSNLRTTGGSLISKS